MTTIVAISSPPGPAQRGIVRLSGPESRALVNRALVGSGEAREALARGAPRRTFAGRFDDGAGQQPVRVFWMPGPASYTREDVAELHLPGAPPLLARAFARLLELGARAAEPGEFTRRAFEHGRLDLSQAEGVLELVHATSDAERRAATQLLAGGLERRMRGLREALDDLRALTEASLDFDESDTGHVPTEELLERVDGIRAQLDAALSWEVARQAPTNLPRVLLFGAPNAGKSSLFNRLAAGGRALVDDLAGTTRDAVSGIWRVGCGQCLLLDAPGLDAGARGPDAAAQRLARVEREAADLVLWVVDASLEAGGSLDGPAPSLAPGIPVLRVWNKIDLAGDVTTSAETIRTSAASGEGVAELEQAVARALRLERASGGEYARELFMRHQGCLREGAEALGAARARLLEGTPLDLVAEGLRAAGRALDGIHGETTPEDVLDRIFARFCLGK